MLRILKLNAYSQIPLSVPHKHTDYGLLRRLAHQKRGHRRSCNAPHTN